MLVIIKVFRLFTICHETLFRSINQFFVPSSSVPVLFDYSQVPPLVSQPKMSYGNTFSVSAELAVGQVWVSARSFSAALRVAASQNFSTSEGRRSAKTALSTALAEYEVTPLFDYDKRFPQRGVYINLSLADWPNKITTMMQSLDVDQADTKETGESNTTEAQGSAPAKGRSNNAVASSGHFKKDDANHGFYQALRQCMQQIGSGDCAYGRQSFETKFNLTWAEGQNQQQGQGQQSQQQQQQN